MGAKPSKLRTKHKLHQLHYNYLSIRNCALSRFVYSNKTYFFCQCVIFAVYYIASIVDSKTGQNVRFIELFLVSRILRYNLFQLLAGWGTFVSKLFDL